METNPISTKIGAAVLESESKLQTNPTIFILLVIDTICTKIKIITILNRKLAIHVVGSVL